MTWQPNIHASLFLNIPEYLNKVAALDEIDTVIKAYQLYTEQIGAQGLEPQLSITRAWRLVKFVDNGMLTMTPCSKCGGHFVTHPHEIARHYVCGLCNPPARAGKGKLAGALSDAAKGNTGVHPIGDTADGMVGAAAAGDEGLDEGIQLADGVAAQAALGTESARRTGARARAGALSTAAH
jgi:hypothetical protein